jgi:hypothetical protein
MTPKERDNFSHYKKLMISVNDTEDENLLQYLPETNKFIADGLKEGAVLVHWYDLICHFLLPDL